MWFLADRFVSEFTTQAASRGWTVDLVEDDEIVIYERPMNSEVHAELGVDVTRRPYGLSLNPSLSVRNKNLSELSARFFGFERGAAYVYASLTDLLRTAGRGSGIMWTVESVDEGPRVAEAVLADVETYGRPFFAQYLSVHALTRHLEGIAATNLEFAQLAVNYAVDGDMEKVRLVVSRLTEMADQQPALLAGQTRKFLSSFLEYFDLVS